MEDKFVGTPLQVVTYLMQDGIDKSQLYELKKHRKKRSLDANAYFHVLCDKIRLKMGISMARCKNELIADYGQVMYIADEPMIYKTNAPECYMEELETIHTKCIKVTEENGKPVYFYRVYRGSHTYDSMEMHKLIEGTIQECRQLDIEYATPDEIARMIALWESKQAKSMNVGEQNEQEQKN